MKKLLSILCILLAMTFTAEAQRPQQPRHRHQPRRTYVQTRERESTYSTYNNKGDFRFHALADMGVKDFGAVFMHKIPYHFSVGGLAEYQVGRVTSIGVGAEYYSSYGERCHLLNNMEQTYIHTLPVYANLKFTLVNFPVSPFVEGRIGYSAPLGEVTCNDPDGVHHYKSMGLYTGGAVGLKIYRIYLSLGMSAIDVVDSDLGFNGGRKDIITDYYVRLSFAF